MPGWREDIKARDLAGLPQEWLAKARSSNIGERFGANARGDRGNLFSKRVFGKFYVSLC